MLKVIHKHAKYILLLTGLAFLSLGNLSSPAHADTAKFQADITPSLTISMSSMTSLTVDPVTKNFDSQSNNISIYTNNPTGYHLYMYSDTTDLIEQIDDRKTIPTLSPRNGGYTETYFEDNKWGYKIGNSNYYPFVSGTEIFSSDSASTNDKIAFTPAVKVSFNQPAGTYRNTITFTLVANPTLMTIQNLDPTYCTESPIYVVDARDGEEYMIQRLADGKCWMLDNMRFDPTEVPLSVMKGKTNAPNTYLGYLKNGGGTTEKYPINGIVALESYDATNLTYRSAQIYSGVKDTVVENTPGLGSGKAGIHYNYCAASAGSFCFGSSNDPGNAVYDICPAGWRMPTTYSSTSDLVTLYNALSQNTTAFRTALSLPLGGREGKISSSSGSSYYWTATNSSNNEMMVMMADNGGYFSEDKWRDISFPVRCLMEERTLNDIEYMQDVTPAILKNTPDETVVTLKDYRDGQEYPVAKSKEEEYVYTGSSSVYMTRDTAVMTRNIAIGCNGTGNTYGDTATGYALNVATTNTEESWTLPTTSFTINDTTERRMLCDSTYGAYYNFHTVFNLDNEPYTGYGVGDYRSDAVPINDICPRGWKTLGRSIRAAEKYMDTFDAQSGGIYVIRSHWDDSLQQQVQELEFDTNPGGWWWEDHYNGPTVVKYKDNSNTYRLMYTWYEMSYYLWTSPPPSSGLYVRCEATDE